MAITIDDLPFAYSAKLEPNLRDSILIKLADTLKSRNVTTTAFVIGERVNTETKPLLNYFASSGNELANHSHSHVSANNISAVEYIKSVELCDSVISKLKNVKKYYRYPYLQRGNEKSRRDSIVRLIKVYGLKLAPVTIDNEDYLYNKYYVDSLVTGSDKEADKIAERYIDYMIDVANETERVAFSMTGRNIKHILLTHANLLNSRYFGVLIDKLKEDGWQFITLKEALEDPIYKEEDKYVGKWGISWLKRIRL